MIRGYVCFVFALLAYLLYPHRFTLLYIAGRGRTYFIKSGCDTSIIPALDLNNISSCDEFRRLGLKEDSFPQPCYDKKAINESALDQFLTYSHSEKFVFLDWNPDGGIGNPALGSASFLPEANKSVCEMSLSDLLNDSKQPCLRGYNMYLIFIVVIYCLGIAHLNLSITPILR
jgi:hypothetical protein